MTFLFERTHTIVLSVLLSIFHYSFSIENRYEVFGVLSPFSFAYILSNQDVLFYSNETLLYYSQNGYFQTHLSSIGLLEDSLIFVQVGDYYITMQKWNGKYIADKWLNTQFICNEIIGDVSPTFQSVRRMSLKYISDHYYYGVIMKMVSQNLKY